MQEETIEGNIIGLQQQEGEVEMIIQPQNDELDTFLCENPVFHETWPDIASPEELENSLPIAVSIRYNKVSKKIIECTVRL